MRYFIGWPSALAMENTGIWSNSRLIASQPGESKSSLGVFDDCTTGEEWEVVEDDDGWRGRASSPLAGRKQWAVPTVSANEIQDVIPMLVAALMMASEARRWMVAGTYLPCVFESCRDLLLFPSCWGVGINTSLNRSISADQGSLGETAKTEDAGGR